MVDGSQLAHVFQNLIGNAIKFHGEEPPRIHIAAERKAGEWEFSVADNGIGISPELFERIFVIFQRIHARDEYSGIRELLVLTGWMITHSRYRLRRLSD